MNKPKKKRQKSGKIKAWEVSMRCVFKKDNDETSIDYIETCSILVHTKNATQAKNCNELHQAIENWVDSLIAEKSYSPKCHLSVDRWNAIRA